MRNCAPIALFVYTRLNHTRLTVEALQRNSLARESDLIIFSDAAREPDAESRVRDVRDYVSGITGFRSITVVARQKNLGLAASILDGVSQVSAERGRVIVLEDDLVTAPHFLTYMNDALDFYAGDDRVIAVHGYMFPLAVPLPETFFLKDPGCWGWATWKRAWDLFDADGAAQWSEICRQGREKEFDLDDSYDYARILKDRMAGRNQSWAILWYATAFLRNKLTLYPGRSLVQNIGLDGSGTHGGKVNSFATVLSDRPVTVTAITVEEDRNVRCALSPFLLSSRRPRSLMARIRSRLRCLASV